MKPKAPREVIVRVADWAAEGHDAVIVTLGLGSCVAIMLHDPAARVGAMAHILLPSKSLARETSNLAKFPETAVPLMLERLGTLGADRRRLVAKLAGGASMFAALMTPGSVQMGERNVVACRQTLNQHGVALVGEATGGDFGRTVRLRVADGRVEISSVAHGAQIL